MKTIFSLLLMLISFNLFAQGGKDNVTDNELEEGMKAKSVQDGKGAVVLLSKAAEKGSIEAMYQLGIVYGYNQYGVLNEDSLNFWFKKAVKAGHPKAKDEWLILRRDRRMETKIDWKTVASKQTNVGLGYWVKVTDWNFIADGRWYAIGAEKYGKKGKELIPFAAAISFQIIDSEGNVVKEARTGGYNYSYSFQVPKDGKYTINAFYDMNDCSGCLSRDKPSGFSMSYSITMWNYDFNLF